MIVMQIHTQIKTYTVHTLCTDRMFFISYHLVWFCGRCFRAGSDVSKRVINHPGSQFFPSFSVMKTADGDLVDLLLFFVGKFPESHLMIYMVILDTNLITLTTQSDLSIKENVERITSLTCKFHFQRRSHPTHVPCELSVGLMWHFLLSKRWQKKRFDCSHQPLVHSDLGYHFHVLEYNPTKGKETSHPPWNCHDTNLLLNMMEVVWWSLSPFVGLWEPQPCRMITSPFLKFISVRACHGCFVGQQRWAARDVRVLFRAYTRGVWHNHVGFFWAVFDTNLGILSYLIILDLNLSSSICKSENTVHELHARREHIHALLGSVREIQLDNLQATWYELQWFSLKL